MIWLSWLANVESVCILYADFECSHDCLTERLAEIKTNINSHETVST